MELHTWNSQNQKLLDYIIFKKELPILIDELYCINIGLLIASSLNTL